MYHPPKLNPEENEQRKNDLQTLSYQACRDGSALGIPITMAFQPIVNAVDRSIYGYESLVRGSVGETAAWVKSKVDPDSKPLFDQACRVVAIELASQLKLASRLHINFLPNTVYSPEACIQATIETARQNNFPLSSITFEIVESEQIRDISRIKDILAHYRKLGFLTALDDFGEGYSSLNLLSEISPDIVKLDLKLIRSIDRDRIRHAIVRSVATLCSELSIEVIAEGVETREESTSLIELGIVLQQGYLFAKPSLEALPAPDFTG